MKQTPFFISFLSYWAVATLFTPSLALAVDLELQTKNRAVFHQVLGKLKEHLGDNKVSEFYRKAYKKIEAKASTIEESITDDTAAMEAIIDREVRDLGLSHLSFSKTQEVELGIEFQPSPLSFRDVVITQVKPDSPAQALGLKVGDTLISLNFADGSVAAPLKYAEDSLLLAEVLRPGPLTPAARQKLTLRTKVKRGRSYDARFGYENLSESNSTVAKVNRGGPAWKAGLKIGDAILSIDQENPETYINEKKKAGVPAHFEINRPGQGKIELQIAAVLNAELEMPYFEEIELANGQKVLYIRIPNVSENYDAEKMHAAMEKASEYEFVIIDFRGNGGGRTDHILSFFLDSDTVMSRGLDDSPGYSEQERKTLSANFTTALLESIGSGVRAPLPRFYLYSKAKTAVELTSEFVKAVRPMISTLKYNLTDAEVERLNKIISEELNHLNTLRSNIQAEKVRLLASPDSPNVLGLEKDRLLKQIETLKEEIIGVLPLAEYAKLRGFSGHLTQGNLPALQPIWCSENKGLTEEIVALNADLGRLALKLEQSQHLSPLEISRIQDHFDGMKGLKETLEKQVQRAADLNREHQEWKDEQKRLLEQKRKADGARLAQLQVQLNEVVRRGTEYETQVRNLFPNHVARLKEWVQNLDKRIFDEVYKGREKGFLVRVPIDLNRLAQFKWHRSPTALPKPYRGNVAFLVNQNTFCDAEFCPTILQEFSQLRKYEHIRDSKYKGQLFPKSVVTFGKSKGAFQSAGNEKLPTPLGEYTLFYPIRELETIVYKNKIENKGVPGFQTDSYDGTPAGLKDLTWDAQVQKALVWAQHVQSQTLKQPSQFTRDHTYFDILVKMGQVAFSKHGKETLRSNNYSSASARKFTLDRMHRESAYNKVLELLTNPTPESAPALGEKDYQEFRRIVTEELPRYFDAKVFEIDHLLPPDYPSDLAPHLLLSDFETARSSVLELAEKARENGQKDPGKTGDSLFSAN